MPNKYLKIGSTLSLEDADVSTAIQSAIDVKQSTSAKGQANGYAGLDGAGLVPVAQLPGLPAAWGAITGVLSAQTDLQAALDAKQATISGLTASGAELNILDGATLSTTELNYVDGVTSAIQTQLDAKQASDTQLTSLAALAYAGNSLKNVRVNSGETGFELYTPTGGGDVVGDDVSTSVQNIVAYSGTGGKNITELTGTQGDILYHNGTSWAKLAAGTSGYYLKAQGAGANPIWALPPGINTLKKTADQTINSGAATYVDIADLTFSVVSGTDYAFGFYITFRSAQTTTGWKSGVNHPGGTLDFWAQSQIIANGAAGVATHTERHNVNVDDMTLLTATVTAGVDLAIRIEGRYKCTSNGTFAARFANELAANTDLVVQKGSWGWYF